MKQTSPADKVTVKTDGAHQKQKHYRIFLLHLQEQPQQHVEGEHERDQETEADLASEADRQTLNRQQN